LPEDVADADPWYRAGSSGESAERVTEEEVHAIPAESPSWSRDGSRACWARETSLYVYDGRTETTKQALAMPSPILDARLVPDGGACDFVLEENLYRYARRRPPQLTRKR
jgi:hypothetical protein